MVLDNSISFNNADKPKDQSLNNFDASFSVLDRYGTYVTNEDYPTDPAIGRDEQIKSLVLVLLTPEKSAILIGKPGVGKTAIVEGLAYRIKRREVPDALQDYQIINIKTASLLGTMPNGETKVQKMIDELKTKEKIILFIDEIHMLIGSTETSSLDFANIFKEGLGRGSIKVIGATTTEEYERYILRDKAFTRRFQKIDVPEPNREETIKIMMGTLPKFEKQTGRKMKYTAFIQERIMSFIVDITSEYKRIFSLGSRYPDVCLTLLKQAFSYTVYDNRPYMDIFDIRKAIENSKNIYPDVIKKELPNFDKMFNDIMLEEKGQKPVEEWRKDGTLTRSELDNSKNERRLNPEREKQIEEENKISVLENVPQIVDRLELRNSKPINSIIDSKGRGKYAKVGNASVSSGLKQKLKNSSNVGALDDALLSSNVTVLKEEKPKDPVYNNFVVTDEIRNGVTDDFLFGQPILSTLEENPEEVVEETQKYHTGGNKKSEGRRMWNDNNRPERFDISNQNFDKYQNYFHQDNMNNNQSYENEQRMDMLMGGSNYNQPPMNGPYDNNMYGTYDNNMNGYMNNNMGNNYGYGNQMYGPNPYDMNMQNNQMYNQPPMYGPMMQNNQMYGPNPYDMNMPNNQIYNQPPMNGPMMPNNQMYGSNPYDMNVPNNQPQYQPQPMDNKDTLFGAPMYSDPTNFNDQDLFNDNNKFNIGNGLNGGNKGETLFGAPMYSDNNTPKNDDGEVDIYGQLLSNDMQIKNGEIVNEFPTFDKIDNLSNITASMNEYDKMQNMNNQQQQQYMNMPNNQMYNQPPMNGPMMPNSQMNQNKNWTFIGGNQNMNQNVPQKPTLFQKNILEDVPKKQENNMSSKENTAAPTSNKDYYEDMKSADFVNFSDLNKGKVKEEDTNKYMGVQVSEDKPQFDLNIETHTEDDNKFDDFYE